MSHGRSPETWATIGARIEAVLATAPPGWVSRGTALALRLALAGLRVDILAATAGAGLSRRDAAEAVDVGDGTWKAWRRAGGWLDGGGK